MGNETLFCMCDTSKLLQVILTFASQENLLMPDHVIPCPISMMTMAMIHRLSQPQLVFANSYVLRFSETSHRLLFSEAGCYCLIFLFSLSLSLSHSYS